MIAILICLMVFAAIVYAFWHEYRIQEAELWADDMRRWLGRPYDWQKDGAFDDDELP